MTRFTRIFWAAVMMFSASALHSLAADPGRADVRFALTNWCEPSAVKNRIVLITPERLFSATGLPIYDQRKFNSGSNGVFWVSNMLASSSYRCVVQAPPARTDFTVYVDTNSVQDAHTVVRTNTTLTGEYAWPIRESDARYLRTGGISNELGSAAWHSEQDFLATNTTITWPEAGNGRGFTSIGAEALHVAGFIHSGHPSDPSIDPLNRCLLDEDGVVRLCWNDTRIYQVPSMDYYQTATDLRLATNAVWGATDLAIQRATNTFPVAYPASGPWSNGVAPTIIWDDDGPWDTDNALSLAMLFACEERGLLKIGGMVNSYPALSWATNDVPYYDAVANYYGRGDLPQGVIHYGAPDYPGYTYSVGQWGYPLATIATDFNVISQPWPTNQTAHALTYPHTITHGTQARPAVDVYRQVLAQSQSPVKILIGGPCKAIVDVWHSGPDKWSSQTGWQLLSNKCAGVYMMSGKFPNNTNSELDNWNAFENVSPYIFQTNFPCPVIYSPVTLGNYATGGSGLQYRAADDIIARGVRQWNITLGWHSGTLATLLNEYMILHAIYGTNYVPGFGTAGSGTNAVFGEVRGHLILANNPGFYNRPTNSWTTAQQDQAYLTLTQPVASYSTYFEQFFKTPPKNHPVNRDMWIPTTSVVSAPPDWGGSLRNSNNVLYWVTATKTNFVSDGR